MSDIDYRAEAHAELRAIEYHFDEGLNGNARATAALAYAALSIADAVQELKAPAHRLVSREEVQAIIDKRAGDPGISAEIALTHILALFEES